MQGLHIECCSGTDCRPRPFSISSSNRIPAQRTHGKEVSKCTYWSFNKILYLSLYLDFLTPNTWKLSSEYHHPPKEKKLLFRKMLSEFQNDTTMLFSVLTAKPSLLTRGLGEDIDKLPNLYESAPFLLSAQALETPTSEFRRIGLVLGALNFCFASREAVPIVNVKEHTNLPKSIREYYCASTKK